MKCQKCKQEFEESEIQTSHDVPKYVGGKDKDGRHNLCKRCHDIYERTVFAAMFNQLPEDERRRCRCAAKVFAKRWFNDSI